MPANVATVVDSTNQCIIPQSVWDPTDTVVLYNSMHSDYDPF